MTVSMTINTFSISDEILGDEDDLCDVDAVFESLLNNTFDEKSGRHVSRREKSSAMTSESGVKQARSKSGHPLFHEAATSALVTTSTSAAAAASAVKSERRKSRTSSVTRKPSKSKLVAGEVKAVLHDHQQSGSATMATHAEQRRAGGDEAVFKKMADPVAALPTSHTKKYLPRQQTWGAGGGSPTQNLGQAHTHTPSPTLSEYDTCDPWDEY